MRLAAVSVVAATATAAVLLGGCSRGDDAPSYDAAAYRPGECRTASEPVFQIDTAVRPVIADDRAPGDAAEDLKRSQQALIAAMPRLADAELRAHAQRVVDAVGFYRIGVDAQNFTPKLAKDVRTASEALLTRCSA